MKQKPTEEQVADYMEEYLPRYLGNKEAYLKSRQAKGSISAARAREELGLVHRMRQLLPSISFFDEAVKMIGHYEKTCAPNGDWLEKGGQRIRSWQRTAEGWCRRTLRGRARRIAGQPMVTHQEKDRPSVGRTEAQIEAEREEIAAEIRKYFPTYRGPSPNA